MIPVPWLACELGWFVAEFGRQPWTVEGLLPTFVSASRLSVLDLPITLTGFVALYTALLVINPADAGRDPQGPGAGCRGD